MKTAAPEDTSAERLRTACDLWTAGVELKRQSLRRMYPGASAEVLDTLVNRWLQERPGAQRGDGPQPTTG